MSNPVIVITTEFGAIRAELFEKAAPITVTNFLHYVNESLYDSGRFHRTVRPDNNANANLGLENDAEGLPNDEIPIDVIQAGTNPERASELDDPIPLERTSETGLSHTDGTLSMARFSPDSAVAEFFICIGDQPEFDFGGHRNPDGQGFAAFGRVIDGMDVVRTIHRQPADGQRLTPTIAISSVVRES